MRNWGWRMGTLAINVYVYTCMYMYVYICVCVCVYVCVYRYIYMCKLIGNFCLGGRLLSEGGVGSDFGTRGMGG